MPTAAVDLDDSLFSMEFITISVKAITREGMLNTKQTIMAMTYKGLAYHPFFHSRNGEGETKGWDVTHVKSGLVVGFGQRNPDNIRPLFMREEDAEKFLLALADLCDWTLDLKALSQNMRGTNLKSKIKSIYEQVIKTSQGEEAA
jgi:hypothetical protein